MAGMGAMKLTAEEHELRLALVRITDDLPRDGARLSKRRIRKLHRAQRLARLVSVDGTFDDLLTSLRQHLATPSEIVVDAISPTLVPVRADSKESRLFAAATLTWSVPVSEGFGRRMRFLVRDQSNGRLIGIIGLTDPVFNLRPRDAWVGWSAAEREERLVHVMDAFVLGALPPYSFLLGGKLVALLAASREVVGAFRAKYRNAEGVISKCSKDPHLVLITTTSALGRSSLYNRLRIPGHIEYLTNVETDKVPLWHTQGFGHFHLSDSLFDQLHQVLVRRKHPYADGNRFGDGPNWKLRVIRQAAAELDAPPDFLRHGIRRQVYVVPLAHNAKSFLRGKSTRPRYKTIGCDEITEFWLERWAKPRSQRCQDWANWKVSRLVAALRRLRTDGKRLGTDRRHRLQNRPLT
jgi:hypothetical protein